MLLSAYFLLLFNKLASPVISDLGESWGLDDELEKLKRAIKWLEALFRDAEQMKPEGEVSALWLRELKIVARDAEDVVDEFEYEGLRRKAENSGEGSTGSADYRGVSKFSPLPSPDSIFCPKEVSLRVEDIWRRLEEISKFKKDLDMGGMLDVGQRQPELKGKMRETSSLLVDSELFGRDEAKNKLIELLRGPTGDGLASSSSGVHPSSISVVSIVGMGGLGKTTLAQWVYNSREVQDHFHVRMWVYVSQDFNLKTVTKQMLEHVIDSQSGLHSVDNLNVLQQKLSERLKEEHFLLILDDVWEEDCKKWREFFAPLVDGGQGSKVLITTRITNVADSAQSVKVELEGLSFGDCWSIFRKHAFPDGNSDRQPNLESIGKEIVKKLKGVPLAATTIGGLLRGELEEREWRNVLQSELWEIEQGGEGILSALRVSFEYLPPHLKQCFVYCSVFHKGCEFDRLELIQLWMAQGYVQPMGRKPVEDVGRSYFNELFNRSLIQFVNGYYVIHDLLHDLGQLILEHDFQQIGLDQVPEIPKDSHSKLHLRLHYAESLSEEMRVLCNFSSLRTLAFVFSGFPHIQVPLDLFQTMKRLRVLDLSGSSLETLPDSIGCLKHLRYLDLRTTKIKCLPYSLCFLYKLQTLKLEGCHELNMLPSAMSNLVNLHYLEAQSELVSMISGIGKLSCLQNLEVFCVSEENGNKIGELKNMKELHGKLCIRNLDRVGSKEDAIEARLKGKHYLEILEMEWADYRDVNLIDQHLEESIIEGLQPPPHLRGLIVKSYAGINFPSWMNSSSICDLEFIHLHRCMKLNCLPKEVRKLTLQDARVLTVLPNMLHHLPLQKLVMCKIPNLKKLPLLPTTLKELIIEDVGLDALPEFYGGDGSSAPAPGANDEDGSSVIRKPVLSILKIHDCPHLTTLHEGFLHHHLRHLKVLSVKNCRKLVNWPEGEGFRATLCSVDEELSIERCPKLEILPEISQLNVSLKKLVVKASPGVISRSFFGQLHKLDSNDIHVEKRYPNLACCSGEVLRHIMDVDLLQIKYVEEGGGLASTHGSDDDSPQPAPISLLYDREKRWSWRRNEHYFPRWVSLVIRERRRGGDCGATVGDDDGSKLLITCLEGHPWSSSLSSLILDGIPDGAFCNPLCLPLLSRLEMYNFREMRRLPTEMLLCHLTALKELIVCGCQEMRLSSVVEGIRSVPSLKSLHIFMCPKLLMPPLSPPPLSPSPLPPLQCLVMDDCRLLTQLLVSNSHHLLTSLRQLHVAYSNFASLTAAEEKGLGTLASSLRHLRFQECPNLQNLPADLRGLLPKLKALDIVNCPKLQRLPGRGLPASMLFLHVRGCPMLPKDFWHEMAHIRVIQINGVIRQGSYSRLLELRAAWDWDY